MEYVDEFSFARSYLGVGEVILWKGKPGKGNLITAQEAFMIPFSLFWCAFAIFWEATALLGDAPLMFKLWGIPFVCVGLYMLFGRFIWTAFMRKRTAYVITNKKIIRARGNRIDMLQGRNMPAARTTVFRDGSGTILFGQPNWYRRGGKVYYDHDAQGFTLDNVPNVARVQQAIESMER